MRSLVIAIAVVLGLGIAAPASAEPPSTHEVIYTKPSGFWTSNQPAKGGSYRWRLLAIGVVLVAITGFGMLRLVKKAAAERDARAR
jgi:hypothetical protein